MKTIYPSIFFFYTGLILFRVTIVLCLTAFPFSYLLQGSPQWIISLHLTLFSTSSSRAPTNFTSSFEISINLPFWSSSRPPARQFQPHHRAADIFTILPLYILSKTSNTYLPSDLLVPHIYEFILYESLTDLMKHRWNKLCNVTKFTSLQPEGGAMEFIKCCNMHMFRENMWKNMCIWGWLGSAYENQNNLERHQNLQCSNRNDLSQDVYWRSS